MKPWDCTGGEGNFIRFLCVSYPHPVLCENPNVEVNERLTLALSEGKISRCVRSIRDEQAQLGWGGIQNSRQKARSKCPTLEVHPRSHPV